MKLQVQIKKKLGTFHLDAAFETEEGVFAILGASGCGKSMTLKCIAGIETPDEGKIVLDGKILFDSQKHINLPPQKRKFGYMFQDYALFPNMMVQQNIMAGMGKNRTRLSLWNISTGFSFPVWKTCIRHSFLVDKSSGLPWRVCWRQSRM